MGDKSRGLYNKYTVTRNDGSSDPDWKHEGCEYFVLDLMHDEYAKAALLAYADSCEADYPLLAKDLRKEMGFVPARCASCAFKKGTYPNRCLTTTADAMKCVMEHVPFYCHHDVNLKHPETTPPHSLCSGWMMLNRADKPVQVPWKFSDEYKDEA